MKCTEILSHVDHTLLSPTAAWTEIKEICAQAIKYRTASVCIPPCYAARVRREFGEALRLCVVIGFPLGYDTTAAKTAAARQAIADGADEVDMVINLTAVKNGDFPAVTEEIAAVKKAVGSNILKVIIETCYLDEEEKIALCRAVTEAGADYIKTSTGFGPSGAAHSDIALFRRHLGLQVKIKAAGGIRTAEDMKQFLSEGCDRLGCSAAVKLLKDRLDEEI